MSFLFRRPGALIVLGSSAIGGAAYRYTAPPSSSSSSLNPHDFTPYTLVDKKPVSSSNSIFTLRNREGAADPESVKEAWRHGVWSIQIKQPQLQIARDYTPLPPTPDVADDNDTELHDIRLLIKKEEGGEVSNYLHRLPEQSTIEIRGPKLEWELPDDIKEVIFLAGGTGIAPALQVAQAMGHRPGTRLHILWANRKREECVGGKSDGTDAHKVLRSPLGSWKRYLAFGTAPSPGQKPLARQGKGAIVQELEALKKHNASQSSGLEVQYFVDEEKTFIAPQDVARRLNPQQPCSRVILIAGPDGFIDYWAGKKIWIGGREAQGPLGGVLGKMDLRGWSVFKL
ncbi:uncharacterized protein EI97DRAFT_131921 [Westerdykella ornata]|uniref:FAD-binding FR-type domain-containing protein n=1 Tax=Westerdykella ornata TaxID=318751 RepID=A0A6A6JD99_WESOR|nr:uncharacterized protein EI97DRAFT_131921 [Westerdykella ornata]KAF2274247.1 hypothetical protein EI97DRAFT_131921 [Westerdykella ornata]